jgi:hypothetical protein
VLHCSGTLCVLLSYVFQCNPKGVQLLDSSQGYIIGTTLNYHRPARHMQHWWSGNCFLLGSWSQLTMVRTASPALLAIGPCKVFLTSKFSYLPFCNPTHKTKRGTANRWETTNSKSPKRIIMIGRSKTDHIYDTPLCPGCTLLCLSLASFNNAKMLGQICLLSQTSMFGLFFIQF